MPEACFICLDSTEYTRNGDYHPNRMLGMLEFVNFLVEAKINKNAENTVGFLCAGGNACTVYESLTADVDRILSSLSSVKIKGKVCHFSAALRIASLALSHRSEPRSEKRIVIFMGSPLQEPISELDILAHKLRKDNVAVDVVTFGVPENVAPLQHFVEKVNKDGNSCFMCIPEGKAISEVLMDSPVYTGPEVVSVPLSTSEGTEGGAGSNISRNFGFSIDPNADPDLQRALQLSMEEELQRQAAAVAGSNNTNNQQQEQLWTSTGATPSGMSTNTISGATASMLPPVGRPMTFEEELQRAIMLSLQDATAQEGNGNSSTVNPSQSGNDGHTALNCAHASGVSEVPGPEEQSSRKQSATAQSANEDSENEEEFNSELLRALEESKKDSHQEESEKNKTQ